METRDLFVKGIKISKEELLKHGIDIGVKSVAEYSRTTIGFATKLMAKEDVISVNNFKKILSTIRTAIKEDGYKGFMELPTLYRLPQRRVQLEFKYLT